MQMKTYTNKICAADEAVSQIHDEDIVATDGFVGTGFAEEIAIALEKRFIEHDHPRDLTLIYAAGQGDGSERGLNHFALQGMVKRVIGGHWGLVPKLQKLALNDEIEAYNLPQGVITHMFRDIAAHKPRTITHVGLNTFVDPRNGGGKINNCTEDDIVELIVFDGQEYLAYKLPVVDVAIVRGTTADPMGNISMEKEALTLEALSVAMAAKNSGGKVIVQVERIAKQGSLNPRDVIIPGIMVDHVVLAEQENHCQTFATAYSPGFSSEIAVPLQEMPAMQLDIRKVIARRAFFELHPDQVVNLGIGMPEGVAVVANEEGFLDRITLTTEPGTIGGMPAGGLDFGASVNMQALIDQPYQFDFYDGGGLDIAFLGLAQVDKHGNLNVSKFGTRLAGAGGFINISQNAKRVVFTGTFAAGSMDIKVIDGRLSIEKDGHVSKFVDLVEQITFSGQTALKSNQPVLFVTERAVFRLAQTGLELIEIAPGVDLDRDILAKMDFHTVMQDPPKLMDPRIFQPGCMDLNNF